MNNKDEYKQRIYAIRRNRLRTLLKLKFEDNQSALARALGQSNSSYVNRLLADPASGKDFKNMADPKAREIETVACVEIGWLDRENEAQVIPIKKDALLTGFTAVPRRLVSLAAGTGTVNVNEEEAPPLAFRTDWLQQNSLDPAALVVAYVSGDSMTPRLHDGDVILIDTSAKRVKHGKVYAIRYGDELRVKRLFRKLDTIAIHSDNPAYPREEIPAARLDDLHIIGRVVWVAGSV